MRLLLLVFVLAAVVAHGGVETIHGSEEQVLLSLLNDYRSANGQEPLSTSPLLAASAEWMSNDMATNSPDYIGHVDSLGRSAARRFADFGYDHTVWRGENLAAGRSTAQKTLEDWKGSPEHGANILNPNYKVAGIGLVYGDGTTYGWYWALHLGGLLSPPPSPLTPPDEPPAPETPLLPKPPSELRPFV